MGDINFEICPPESSQPVCDGCEHMIPHPRTHQEVCAYHNSLLFGHSVDGALSPMQNAIKQGERPLLELIEETRIYFGEQGTEV